MMKIVLLSAFCFWAVQALSLDKVGPSTSSEEKEVKEIMESLKEFVKVVDQYNLNVSVIGSHKKYGSGGKVKECLSLTMHMPPNEVPTEGTLDDAVQDKYLKKIEVIAGKEHVGAKTRVIKIQNGKDTVVDEQTVKPHNIIYSPGYKFLTKYENGHTGFTPNASMTSEILYNYHIRNPSNEVKNVQVITANVIIEEVHVSKDFPAPVLAEIKHILPKLWLSVDDHSVFARLLVNHLDEKFDGSFQAITNVHDFALGGTPYANLAVGEDNVVVFSA